MTRCPFCDEAFEAVHDCPLLVAPRRIVVVDDPSLCLYCGEPLNEHLGTYCKVTPSEARP